MGSIYDWDETAANNDTADSDMSWVEGMAPSLVNNGYREGMRKIATFRKMVGGAVTTAGTSTVYTLTYNHAPSAYSQGFYVLFECDETCGADPTLNVNAIGAANLVDQSGTNLVAGALIAGGYYLAVYDNATGKFVVLNIAGGDALVANPLSQFAATTSAQLAGVISNETGTGLLVFATDPVLTTPNIGTPSAGVLTNCTGYAVSASVTVEGVVELATTAEIDTATDAARVMSPDAFNASDFGIAYVQLTAFDYTTDTETGDGAAYFPTPSSLAGYNLVEVQADVITAGTTGTTDIQIHNLTQAADILSTKLTIDSAETSSLTAAAAAVINAAQDDITAGDVLRIDVDAVSTTAAKGLIVTLGFRKP